MQFFHWYVPADGTWWNKVKDEAAHLANLGITAVWLPPMHKGKDGALSSGYDVYDLYDLGEFDQKGSIRTKYGTKEELLAAIAELKKHKLQVYADVIINHMGGGDETEKIKVLKVDEENRNAVVSDPFEIEAYTRFTFPGRKGKYSQFIWDHQCFTGVDYAHDLRETAIYSILNEYGDGWEDVVDPEKGNFDYLMFCDVEFRNPAVREELKRFIGWLLHEVQFDGMRLDAVKHISPHFMTEFLDEVKTLKPNVFAVGEYWAPGNTDLLLRYLDAVGDRMSLFDAPLHHNFFEASRAGSGYDLRTILDNTLLKARSDKSVTVVDNHDTQPLQALEAPVEAWFKPLAYALTLLRAEGYPCVFYPDLYGAHYRDKGGDDKEHEIFLEKCRGIEALISARKRFAYGPQRDYFESNNCIGWVREGVKEIKHSGCAVVLSNGDATSISMDMGKRFRNALFVDHLENHSSGIVADKNGRADFPVNANSVSVWIVKPQ